MGLVRKLKSVLGLDDGPDTPRKPRTSDVTIEPDPSEPTDKSASTEEPERPVTEISGIGPAYADRLEAVGVTTIADLREADADTLSSETDIAAKRIEGWIDQAGER